MRENTKLRIRFFGMQIEVRILDVHIRVDLKLKSRELI